MHYNGFNNAPNSPMSTSFAALSDKGYIHSWGDFTSAYGVPQNGGYIAVFTTSGAFAAIKEDGYIDVWGDKSIGGENGPSG